MENKTTHHWSWVGEDNLTPTLFLFSQPMRRLLYLMGLIFLASCTADVVAPCGTNDELIGRICSEFKSRNDASVGTVDYAYADGGNSLTTDFIAPNGKVERTIRYTFKDGAVLTKRETIDGVEKALSYSFDDQDSISSIAYFTGVVIDSITFCDFENGKRVQIRVQAGDEILRFDDYRYDSDGTLNRISHYSADSSLLGYLEYELFGNNKIRVKKKTPQHLLIHTDNFELNTMGKVEQKIRRSAVGDTLMVVTNTYNQLGKLVEKSRVSGIEANAIRYYYYK
jgi:hypothetical protein